MIYFWGYINWYREIYRAFVIRKPCHRFYYRAFVTNFDKAFVTICDRAFVSNFGRAFVSNSYRAFVSFLTAHVMKTGKKPAVNRGFTRTVTGSRPAKNRRFFRLTAVFSVNRHFFPVNRGFFLWIVSFFRFTAVNRRFYLIYRLPNGKTAVYR